MKRWICAAVVACVGLVMAGCASSPPPDWHSLVPAAPAQTTPAPPPAARTLVIGVVTLPDEVDRPQLVVRGAGGAPLRLDAERWSEPLKAQLPRALALALAPQLPATLVTAAPGGAVLLPTWRVTIDVQRFELQRGPDRAVLRAVWLLSPGGVRGDGPTPPPQLFETAVPATGSGPAALVAAMAAAVAQLSGQISRSVCAAGPC